MTDTTQPVPAPEGAVPSTFAVRELETDGTAGGVPVYECTVDIAPGVQCPFNTVVLGAAQDHARYAHFTAQAHDETTHPTAEQATGSTPALTEPGPGGLADPVFVTPPQPAAPVEAPAPLTREQQVSGEGDAESEQAVEGTAPTSAE